MHGDGAHAVGLELPDHAVGPTLGAAEHEGLPVALDQLGRDGDSLGPVDLPEVVVDVPLRLLGRLDGDLDRVTLIAADDRLHLAPDGGREEHDLAVRRRLVQQAAHGGQEAHVGHAVRLVEHHRGDIVEPDVTPLDQVLQAPGARHDDVDALLQGAHLLAVAGATEDRHDALALVPEEVARGPRAPARPARGSARAPAPSGRRGSERWVFTTSGMPNASVLPDPVGALPQMSRPASAAGMVAD